MARTKSTPAQIKAAERRTKKAVKQINKLLKTMTMAEVAQCLGYSTHASISQIVSGYSNISEKKADALNEFVAAL